MAATQTHYGSLEQAWRALTDVSMIPDYGVDLVVQGKNTVELASWELPLFAVVRASHASTFFEASIPLTKTAKFGRKLVSLL